MEALKITSSPDESQQGVNLFGIAAAALALFGFLYPYEVLLGVTSSFGSVPLILALFVLGPRGGLIVGLFVTLMSFLGGLGPYHYTVFFFELIFLALWLWRKNSAVGLFLGDAVFWAVIGIPWVFFEQHMLAGDTVAASLLTAAILAFGGFTNLVLAHLALLVFRPLVLLLPFATIWSKSWRISSLTNTALVSSFLFPMAIILIAMAHWDTKSLKETVKHEAEIAGYELSQELLHEIKDRTTAQWTAVEIRRTYGLPTDALHPVEGLKHFLTLPIGQLMQEGAEDELVSQKIRENVTALLSAEPQDAPIREPYVGRTGFDLYSFEVSVDGTMIDIFLWDEKFLLDYVQAQEPHFGELENLRFGLAAKEQIYARPGTIEQFEVSDGPQNKTSHLKSVIDLKDSKVWATAYMPELDSVLYLSFGLQPNLAALERKYAFILLAAFSALAIGLLINTMLALAVGKILQRSQDYAESVLKGRKISDEFLSQNMLVEFRWLSRWFGMVLQALHEKVEQNDRIVQDIRVLLANRKELARTATELSALIETSSTPILGVDLNGHVNEWNRAAEQVTGYSKEEVVGGKMQLIDLIVLQNKAAVQNLLDRAMQGENTEATEVLLHAKDGSFVELLLSSTTRRNCQEEIIGVFCVGQEISALKKAQAQLAHWAKLATIGEMATGVAHELNQPLNIIRLAAGNCLARLPENMPEAEFIRSKLNRIEGQVVRASTIIDHMRIFSRKTNEPATDFSPAKSFVDVLDLIGEQLRLASIDVSIDLDNVMGCMTRGHFIQIEQVYLNILSNARDAILSSGSELKEIKVVGEVDADTVRLRIQDTGGGISEATKDRMFEPFYTTKEIGKGTGLGLSVSYGIVTDMGGTITADNIGDGACIEICLPISNTPQTPVP